MNKGLKIERKALRYIDDVLQVNWPAVFPRKPEPKVPLAIGITEELLKKSGNDLSKASVQAIIRAFELWCRGRRYYEACSVPGAARYNLAGEVCGYVTDKEAEYARSKLINFKEKNYSPVENESEPSHKLPESSSV